MKIHVISDVHNEFHRTSNAWHIPTVKADAIIVAGDIDTRIGNLYNYFKRLKETYKYVIYIAGNHEYYAHADLKEYIPRVEDLDGVYFLQNEGLLLDGVKFYGGTMWTSVPIRELNDEYLIKNIDHSLVLNKEFVDNFEDCHVCISHHVPSLKLVDMKYRYGAAEHYNKYYFADNVEHLFDRMDYWIFGHSHISCNRKIGETIFISNPLGYKHEINHNFNKELR